MQYGIKFGLLQVRENAISLRKWSGCIALLRILEGTLFILPCFSLATSNVRSLSWKLTRVPATIRFTPQHVEILEISTLTLNIKITTIVHVIVAIFGDVSI